MRHSKAETTLAICAQIVPDNQRKAALQLGDRAPELGSIAGPVWPITGPIKQEEKYRVERY